MRYRVRIEIERVGTRYISGVNEPALITRLVDGARKFHNALNADMMAGQYQRTFDDLGIVADCYTEEAT